MVDLSSALSFDQGFHAGKKRLATVNVPKLFETLRKAQGEFGRKQHEKKPAEEKPVEENQGDETEGKKKKREKEAT